MDDLALLRRRVSDSLGRHLAGQTIAITNDSWIAACCTLKHRQPPPRPCPPDQALLIASDSRSRSCAAPARWTLDVAVGGSSVSLIRALALINESRVMVAAARRSWIREQDPDVADVLELGQRQALDDAALVRDPLSHARLLEAPNGLRHGHHRGYEAVVPSVQGRAWITGYVQQVLQPDDPFPTGLTVGDIWSTLQD